MTNTEEGQINALFYPLCYETTPRYRTEPGLTVSADKAGPEQCSGTEDNNVGQEKVMGVITLKSAFGPTSVWTRLYIGTHKTGDFVPQSVEA